MATNSCVVVLWIYTELHLRLPNTVTYSCDVAGCSIGQPMFEVIIMHNSIGIEIGLVVEILIFVVDY